MLQNKGENNDHFYREEKKHWPTFRTSYDKNSQQSRNKGSFLNVIKIICPDFTANNILRGEAWSFSQAQEKKRVFTLLTFVPY